MKYHLKLGTIVSLLFILPKIFLGQQIISSKIIGEKDKNPVSYANIWIKNKNIGTTSDENGHFTLKVANLAQNDSIIISSIGFYDTLIQITNIPSEIILKQKLYQISQITVLPRQRKELILNDLSESKFKVGIMNDTTPQIVGHYFPYSKEDSAYCYLKSDIIYTRNSHKGKLNLRLYSFDTSKVSPIKELINQKIVIDTKKSIFFKPKPVEIDLSKYNILFPKQGILIGVEWLIIPENRYTVTFTKENSTTKEKRVMYSPDLCATFDKAGYQYQYRKGVWWKPFIINKNPECGRNECYYNPAITLKLSD